MEQSPKEPKRGTIESFFSSQTAKKQKPDNSLISTSSETAVSPSNQTDRNDFFFPTGEQEEPGQTSLCLLDLSPLSPSASHKQQQEQISLSSSLSEQQQERSSLSSVFPVLLSSSTNTQQQERISSSSSAISSSTSSSPKNPTYAADISRSANDLPSQPQLAAYPVNKDKRSFRSNWFSQFPWLEYSKQTDSVYCYYCRHFNIGLNLNNRVRNIYSIYISFRDSLLLPFFICCNSFAFLLIFV
jgi:hypothetical protein